MSMMTRYEWKKVFSRRGGRTALLLLAVTTALVCWFSCGVSYVDEAGVTRSGFSAAAKLKPQSFPQVDAGFPNGGALGPTSCN